MKKGYAEIMKESISKPSKRVIVDEVRVMTPKELKPLTNKKGKC